MINLKVKTLDSQNHDFSVEDDITVRQFKEQIAEKINVSVDMQRLIYCGRVLSDDKPLKEYDVNGKVVHLVQRAPPSARGSSTGGSNVADENNRGWSNRRSRSSDNAARPPIFRGMDDFNTMYFGSMTSIPLNVNATTPPQIPSVSPSSTLCMNRITVARHMLQCADNIISYLESPERGLNNTTMDMLSQQTMESTVFEVGISAVGDVDIPHNQMQNFVQAFQGAVSAAFRQNGISNVTVQQQDTLNPSVQVFGTIPDSAIITPPNTSATATPAQESSGASSGSSSTSSSTSESSADSRRQARPGSSRNQTTTSTQTLAEVVNQMRRVQRRMEPFVTQYFEILQNDPAFEESDTVGRENAQRVFDRISEALHYMSHAQHAISDLMLDLQTSAPRHLCCRPILVEQSAFVSSGIAAVPNNINLANLLRASNNNNNTDMGNNNINAQIINVAIPAMAGATPNGPIHIPLLDHAGSRGSTAASGPNPGTGSAPATTASGPNTGSMPPPNQQQQQQQQQQGQSSRNSTNNLPDEVVTRVYIPLYDPSTVARMQNIIQSMGATSRDGSATRAANPRSSNTSANSNTSAGGNNATTNDDQQPRQTATASPSAGNSRTTTNNTQMQVARLIQAVVNAAPIHADIHVQINAGGNSPGSSAPSTPGTATTTTSNSSGGPQANPTMTNNTSTNTNSGSNDNGSQSRFATVTLPTTSTQTRSTPRPHVHSIPPAHIRNVRPGIPANILSSFDRFLPCNSHHVRENTDRAATDATTPRNAHTASNASSNNSSNGSTPTPAATQPSAPPSESLSSLPFNLFGSQFTLADFEQIAPNPNTLNRVRDSLQAYIIETLFSGHAISETTMQEAVSLLIQRLEPILSRVSNYDLPDYDTRASIENLIRTSIPFCINLIREDNSQQFGVRLLRFLITFVRRFFMILVTGIGQNNAQSFSGELLNMIIFNTQDGATVNPAMLQLFLPAIHRQLERSGQDDRHDIQQFLVIRRPAPGQSQSVSANRAPSPMDVDDIETVGPPELVSDIAEISISIEQPIVNLDQCAAIVISANPNASQGSASSTMDSNEDVTMTIPVTMVEHQVPPPLQNDDNELPAVIIGSEPWHSHLPPTWIPVITRDITRQRRQNPQGPYSDAYISGMSSKRRKLIAETKPSSDVPSLITDGVRQAFHATGINPISSSSSNSNMGTANIAVDDLARTISDDTALQSSYCETMKASIRERLSKDPDYDAKRYPNCSKYFEK